MGQTPHSSTPALQPLTWLLDYITRHTRGLVRGIRPWNRSVVRWVGEDVRASWLQKVNIGSWKKSWKVSERVWIGLIDWGLDLDTLLPNFSCPMDLFLALYLCSIKSSLREKLQQ